MYLPNLLDRAEDKFFCYKKMLNIIHSKYEIVLVIYELFCRC